LRLLLDTHALLWFYLDDSQLSGKARGLILDPANTKLVSPASYWEIAIKIGKKKYTLTKPFEEAMREAIDLNGFGYLHIEPKHTALLTTMVAHHNDPFDRLLVAQALAEDIPLVSADGRLDYYGVQRFW
jgi:PIN domain nuclease of toxin-antitoxin system